MKQQGGKGNSEKYLERKEKEPSSSGNSLFERVHQGCCRRRTGVLLPEVLTSVLAAGGAGGFPTSWWEAQQRQKTHQNVQSQMRGEQQGVMVPGHLPCFFRERRMKQVILRQPDVPAAWNHLVDVTPVFPLTCCREIQETTGHQVGHLYLQVSRSATGNRICGHLSKYSLNTIHLGKKADYS